MSRFDEELTQEVIDVQRILCQANCDGVPANCNDCLFHGCCGYTEMAMAILKVYNLARKQQDD